MLSARVCFHVVALAHLAVQELLEQMIDEMDFLDSLTSLCSLRLVKVLIYLGVVRAIVMASGTV